MKKIFIVTIILFITILSCNNQSQEMISDENPEFNIVREFFENVNNNDTVKINNLLAENNIIKINGKETSKQDMFNQFNTSFLTRIKDTIISIKQIDTIVEVVLNSSNNYMISLKIPPIETKQKFYIKQNKIIKFSTDTVVGTYKVYKEFENKAKMFHEWLSIKYPDNVPNMENLFDVPEKYLKEYSKLDKNDLEKFFISNLRGEYICKTGLYNKLVFKGKSTVVVYGLGIPFPTSYVIDENYIRIKTDKSDLLLQIKDSRTLIGEGFAKGKYEKK